MQVDIPAPQPAPRAADFLREQLAMNLQCYMQVRPGSRAAAEVIRDRKTLRNELAAALRAARRNSTGVQP